MDFSFEKVIGIIFFDGSNCYIIYRITNLIRKIKASGFIDLDYDEHSGKDFLYLFDLLAHTSGIDSTLRVLTYADSEFHHMCTPKIQLQPLEVSKLNNSPHVHNLLGLRKKG